MATHRKESICLPGAGEADSLLKMPVLSQDVNTYSRLSRGQRVGEGSERNKRNDYI